MRTRRDGCAAIAAASIRSVAAVATGIASTVMRPGKSYRTIDVPAPAGFTLLELMIVMAILAIVAAITLVSVARARTNADATSAINSLRTIVSAQAAFRTACGH